MKICSLYFIGKCLSLDEHPSFRETIIAHFSDPDYNWNDFIWICSNHLIIPVIYLKFRTHDLLSYLPEVLVRHLQEIYELNFARNKQILLQMKEITATLNNVNISPIYLKGTGNLIDGIYSDIGERIIGDIDFLVPENIFLKAAELFKNEGYQICRPTNEPIDQMKHYPRLWKKDVAADIEIHRLPVTKKYSTNFNADHVLKFKKVVLGHPGCYVLRDNHKVIQSFIHSQLANTGHALGVVSLRDVYDLYCFSKRVDLKKIPQAAPFRQKCIAYFKLSEKLLNLPGNFYSKETISSRCYRLKHDLNFSSTLHYKVNRIAWVLSEAISYGVQQISQSYSDPALRWKIVRSLFTPKWYGEKVAEYHIKYKVNH
ncbi:MAG: nucleotidyltransferase family protein [Bacteroidia bacterium]|nr:nucleotidyltransferase family protein [Bacteroidia bacterium]